MKKYLYIIVLSLTTISLAKAQNADSIATNYVGLIGGAQAWEALSSTKFSITYNQAGFDIPGYILSDSSNRYRFELEFSGMQLINATDGQTAWKLDNFSGATDHVTLTGSEADALNNRVFLDEFIDYANRGYSLTAMGTATVEGANCYKIKLEKGSNESFHYFDTATGLKVAKEETVGGETILTAYSLYADLQGLKFPMKQVKKSGGATLAVITVTNIELNAAVTGALFALPGN